MLSAIREIGILVSNQVVTPSSRTAGKIIAIVLNEENTAFQDVELEDFDPDKADRYLYKDRGSKGNMPAPFAQITETGKTFKKKILQWLSGCEKISNLEAVDREFIKRICQALAEKEDSILEAADKLASTLQKKDKKFLTIKLEGGKTFLGDYEIFRRAVNHFADEKTKKSCSSGSVCSVCGEIKDKVAARTSVYQFDTDDKPGFIAGGFDKVNNWRNIPVCGECRTFLAQGRRFIDSKLDFRFYGLRYCLIPRLLMANSGILEEIIFILSDSHQSVSLKERIKRRITSDENDILEFLSENKDILTLNFLFLQQQNSAERISLLIEDVFPSRLRTIFEAKDCVDSAFGEPYNFGKVRTFFSKSDEGKRNSDLNKYFLEIVDAVFRGKDINFSFLTRFHMAVIRREFVNDGYFTFKIKDAAMNTMFFDKLGLITFQEDTNMEEDTFNEVFSRFGKMLNTPEKRGIFLLGALTQLLLNKQWAARETKPFMKKLKSLRMDEKDIKGLLPAVQNKLEEYDAFDKGKRLLAAESSKYLLQAQEGWKMPVDEINFYFCCGMNLCDDIASIVYKKES
jgi:CRISPR-associated protein Csh1